MSKVANCNDKQGPPPPLSPSKRNLAPTSVNPHKKKNTDLHHPSITNRENIKENGQFNKIVQNR